MYYEKDRRSERKVYTCVEIRECEYEDGKGSVGHKFY